MSSQSCNRAVGDNYEVEVLEAFGEEYRVEIYETIYNLYELDLPLDVTEKLVEFEKGLRAKLERDPYAEYDEYLTDYYSAWAEECENKSTQPMR